MTKEEDVNAILTMYKVLKTDLDKAIKRLSTKTGKNDVLDFYGYKDLRKLRKRTRKLKNQFNEIDLTNLYDPFMSREIKSFP